jgi:GT2 family glycosyltransferase
MKFPFTLIVCTYMRPNAVLQLLNSVKLQTLYPNEILIVDGSTNTLTQEIISQTHFENLTYYLVSEKERGLTKQRNFGIARTSKDSEVICFLDDDTVLEPTYFEEIIKAFQSDDAIVGVGGVALNENNWRRKEPNKYYNSKKYYQWDDFVYPEGSRNIVRNVLGLQSNLGPGKMPEYSNGRTCGFPLDGKIYEVDLLIGMSFSFRRIVYENIAFSTYFEGYGLYEDADYSIKAQQFGKNVMATRAQLNHYHDQSGRPNKFKYGKMVVRNGWYVWRLKYPKPSLNAIFKWNAIVGLLIIIRFSNIFTTRNRKEAFTEFAGRMMGWLSLIINKPH